MLKLLLLFSLNIDVNQVNQLDKLKKMKLKSWKVF